MLKMFLRELPTYLLNPMYGAFIQAQKLPSSELRQLAILLTVHMLPIENVGLFFFRCVLMFSSIFFVT
jgi:hypothetical protein